MRIYHHVRRSHTLYVAPAGDPRAVQGGVDSDWLNENGTPKLIEVCFDSSGMTDVPDNLGRYLVATHQAKRTRLWLPQLLAA